MSAHPIITFLSDFGTRDGYVGSVKGVIKSFRPQIEIIDISHAIEPFNIAMAAYTLLNYYRQYPPGTVHLAVVDPGVGSARKPLMIQSADYHFVGPDNGLFRYIQQREQCKIYELDSTKLSLSFTGQTFHARDVFAPVAAQLATGTPAEACGRVRQDTNPENPVLWIEKGNTIEIKPITCDHFGNIIFGITRDDLAQRGNKIIRQVCFKGFTSSTIQNFYAEKEVGQPLVLWNSQQFLEIAVNQGSAADFFELKSNTDKLILTME